MQIIPSFHSPDQIHLKYDHEARQVFSKARAIAESIIGNTTAGPSTISTRPAMAPQQELGLEVIVRLATNVACEIEILIDDLQAATDLVLLVGAFCTETGKPSTSLRDAIILLSSVTPYPIPPMRLPPAEEVFDKDTVDPEVWKTFEAIRLSNKSGPALLTLFDIYHTRCALHQIQPTNAHLRLLLQVLDISTRVFRVTMQFQALAVITPKKPKKNLKRRKS